MGRFSPVLHESRRPDIAPLLGVLGRLEIRYVLVGSVAAALYGVELQPGDLDIVPDTEESNLRRLVDVLREIEAQPLGPFGNWRLGESGEMRWIPRPTTERDLAEWLPDVHDPQSLDHLYVTRFGNFDVVPEIAGTYETLRHRAGMRAVEGVDVWLVHIDELLARLTIPRREKDCPRVAKLRQIQRTLVS